MSLDYTILHLEDDENDSMLFRRALKGLKYSGSYCRVATIGEAIDYLSGQGKFSDRQKFPLPQVLVADNAEKTPALLGWLDDHQSSCKSITRVILTGGMRDADIEAWLARGVKAVLLKGSTPKDMTASASEILN